MTSTLAIIGGTGLNEPTRMKGHKIHEIETPYGFPSAAVIEGELHGHRMLFMARHGQPHRLPPHAINYRANLWALQKLGATDILAVNAVGSIDPSTFPAQAIVIPDQIIDYTWGRVSSFFDQAGDALKHVDFSYPYTETLRELIAAAASTIGETVHVGAVYGATQGPRLETAAEILRMERDGCHLVGMTGMPEAALARELKLNYASISLVVNPAAGKSAHAITLREIDQNVAGGMNRVRHILDECVKQFHQ